MPPSDPDERVRETKLHKVFDEIVADWRSTVMALQRPPTSDKRKLTRDKKLHEWTGEEIAANELLVHLRITHVPAGRTPTTAECEADVNTVVHFANSVRRETLKWAIKQNVKGDCTSHYTMYTEIDRLKGADDDDK